LLDDGKDIVEVMMEGNACYKLTTIQGFIAATGSSPIKTVVDVGANVGDITLLFREVFPEARIFGFEAVEEYYRVAAQRTERLEGIKLFNQAMTAQHRFADDLGEQPHPDCAVLAILKGLPAAGPGWSGGSLVVQAEQAGRLETPGYTVSDQTVSAVTLAEFMRREGLEEIDILKMDCEGCEHSVLGCADTDTLRRVRFITGEYHGISRFNRVMRQRLFQTHKVNLVGDRDLGCFFAERLNDSEDGILLHDKSGMRQLRHWLSDEPMDWHLFNPMFVLHSDRVWHGIV
jgi:FkbM family methyltransferase